MDEAEGRDWFSTFLPKEQRSRVRKQFESALRGGLVRGEISAVLTKSGARRLIEHPRIDAVAVVGVPHPHSGESVKAYVVVGEGAIEEDDVVAFCAEYLPTYKCPTKVVFVDEIPRGLGGKVLRRALR